MTRNQRYILVTVLTMVAFSVCFTAFMSLVHVFTQEKIKRNEQQERLSIIQSLIHDVPTDDKPLTHARPWPPTAAWGMKRSQTIYPLFNHQKPAGLIFSIRAPDGYGGPIEAILAVNSVGQIIAIRVLSHHETPGLGDYIDGSHGDFSQQWISQFRTMNFTPEREKNWAVQKDGGQFQYMTGATISPRALIQAVRKALLYYHQNHALFYHSAEQEKDSV